MHWADRRASVAVPDPLSDARMAGIGAIRPELPVRPVGWRCPFSVIARSESRGSREAVENRHSSESNDCHSSGIPALRRPAQCVAFLDVRSFGFAKFASGTAFRRAMLE